jgi:release factor glutamine methyltransferase
MVRNLFALILYPLSHLSSSISGFMPLSIHQLLSQATAVLTTNGIPNPRLDAEVLLAHALGLTRAGLYARLQDVILEADVRRFHQLLYRRQRREPLQYITGGQEFWSLEFKVTPDVLIPRPETELIVEVALQLLSQHSEVGEWGSGVSRKEENQKSNGKGQKSKINSSAIRILDVGTGSGCVAIALAKELPEAEMWATDVSSTSLAVAQENAQRHGVADRVHFLQGDLFFPLHSLDLTFDLIISNPPYIADDDIPTLQPEVSKWEPRGALDGGHDGLDFYRRLLGEGPQYLHSGGWLVMEIGHGQQSEVLRLARQQPTLTAACDLDYEGRARIVRAQKHKGKIPAATRRPH